MIQFTKFYKIAFFVNDKWFSLKHIILHKRELSSAFHSLQGLAMFFPWGLQHHVVPNIEAIILFYLIIFVFLFILVMILLLSFLTSIPSRRQRERQKAILYFRMPHDTFCLPSKYCINHCFQMLLELHPP